MYGIVNQLHNEINIPIDAGVEAVIEGIREYNESPLVKKLFLRPWIDTSDDREMIRRSQLLENDCLYSIYKEDKEFYINILNGMI